MQLGTQGAGPEQLRCRSPAGFLLTIDIRQLLAGAAFTTKQASSSSTDNGGRKRRSIIYACVNVGETPCFRKRAALQY
jgi:hypothetical protein